MNKISANMPIEEVGIKQGLLLTTFQYLVVRVVWLHVIGSEHVVLVVWMALHCIQHSDKCRGQKIIVRVQQYAPFSFGGCNGCITGRIGASVFRKGYETYPMMIFSILLHNLRCVVVRAVIHDNLLNADILQYPPPMMPVR